MKINYKKKCSKCNKLLDLDQFTRGRNTYCKECMRKYLRAYKKKIKRAESYYRDFDNTLLTDADMEREIRKHKNSKIKTKLNALADYAQHIERVTGKIKSFNNNSKKPAVFRGPNAEYMSTDYFNIKNK